MTTTLTLNWPRCCCGHIAQAHNRRLGQEPKNYGCDECNCLGYTFPAATPQSTRDALEASRDARLKELDAATAALGGREPV